LRLWNKDLIDVLPKHQLIGQWRECCAIASNLAKFGTPNHILVNKILDYPIDHFYTYSIIFVYRELVKRDIKVMSHTLEQFSENIKEFSGKSYFEVIPPNKVFDCWHNTRYLLQCLSNLEEKYDCGGITFEEWFKILNKTRSMHVYCEETYQSLFV